MTVGITTNRRALSYPWARPYYPTVPRPHQPGGLLSFLVDDPNRVRPSLTMADVEEALYDRWTHLGDAPTTILVSEHTALIFDWKLRIWGRIRRHRRWANPRRRR